MAAAQSAGGPANVEIKVRLPENMIGGVYANSMMVQHGQDDFVMDFISVVAGAGTVVARVVTSPSHMKRVVAALQDNVKKYESTHGPIRGSTVEPQLRVGFHPSDENRA
jgi:hypothetical protein